MNKRTSVKTAVDFPGFDEAMSIMRQHVPGPVVRSMPLMEALGFVIAETIKVPVDSPPFDQSAMDGYALRFSSWDKKSPLEIIGEVAAGRIFKGKVRKNTAVRIFTGAAIPAGCDTVIVREKVMVKESYIILDDPLLKKGSNVRKKGSHMKKGAVAVRAGDRLSVGTIGFLASLGIAELKIYSPPKISVIVTGSELTRPGRKLKPGHVYESNSFALAAALEKIGIHPYSMQQVKDDPILLREAISGVLAKSDMLLITGGVSAGDYDFVTAALSQCGVRTIFHKVKQKPGKPLFFGSKGEKIVFGLPGNPAAVLSCFYTYVVEAISQMTQKEYVPVLFMPSLNSYTKKGSLTNILKARTSSRGVEILGDQESYKLNTFAEADALVILPSEKQVVEKGDMLEVRIIDFFK